MTWLVKSDQNRSTRTMKQKHLQGNPDFWNRKDSVHFFKKQFQQTIKKNFVEALTDYYFISTCINLVSKKVADDGPLRHRCVNILTIIT